MSIQKNSQQIVPSTAENLLRTRQKDIVCGDCGGISAAKIQELLSTLEGNTKFLNHHNKNSSTLAFPNERLSRSIKSSNQRINTKNTSMRNNSHKNSSNRRSSLSVKRNMKKTARSIIDNKRRLHSTKIKNKQSRRRTSLSSRNNNKSKSKNKKSLIKKKKN